MSYDYSDVERLQARARRERSETVYRLIFAPIAAWFRSARTQKSAGHAARPHFARQGW
jgi:hypothetical protein